MDKKNKLRDDLRNGIFRPYVINLLIMKSGFTIKHTFDFNISINQTIKTI